MRITVTKSGTQGNSPAPNITDPLLSSVESKIARGRSELAESVDAYSQTVKMPLQVMFNTGQIAEIHDHKYGIQRAGQVKSVSIDIARDSIDITIDVESKI